MRPGLARLEREASMATGGKLGVMCFGDRPEEIEAMATPREAAIARVACAICSETDLVQVKNLDRAKCTFTVCPADALFPSKKFSDHGLDDVQMAGVVEAIAGCSPEASVQKEVRGWPPIPADTLIVKVIDMLEALILQISGWNGVCMSDDCCRPCGQ